jgi:hypothetical protein
MSVTAGIPALVVAEWHALRRLSRRGWIVKTTSHLLIVAAAALAALMVGAAAHAATPLS